MQLMLNLVADVLKRLVQRPGQLPVVRIRTVKNSCWSGDFDMHGILFPAALFLIAFHVNSHIGNVLQVALDFRKMLSCYGMYCSLLFSIKLRDSDKLDNLWSWIWIG